MANLQRPRNLNEEDYKLIAELPREYARMIGELVLLSNSVHDRFMLIFLHLMDPNEHKLGEGVWHSLKSDASQRDMLNLIAKIRLKDMPDAAGAITYAVQSAAKLATFRNIFVHAPISICLTPDSIRIASSTSATPFQREKIDNNNTLEMFNMLKADFEYQASYVHTLMYHLTADQNQKLMKKKPIASHERFIVTPKSKI